MTMLLLITVDERFKDRLSAVRDNFALKTDVSTQNEPVRALDFHCISMSVMKEM